VADSPAHVELVFTQQVTRKGPIGTTIVLEEVA